jgi:hypothetical protein
MPSICPTTACDNSCPKIERNSSSVVTMPITHEVEASNGGNSHSPRRKFSAINHVESAKTANQR